MILLEKLGQQLGHPTRSVYGWLITKFLKYHNKMLEESAVSLSGIQPGDTVLELIGVDYSKYMHKMAGDLLKELVSNGKVSLYQCDVAAMPLADNMVDKVFHCNCYYYWPDLRKGAAEIHRVMKPGEGRVVSFASRREFPGRSWQPEAYMAALRASGFNQVTMEDHQHRHITCQAIYATADK
uniref:Methyltransferase type 11 domain-containing protein n=1 Tax=Oncorhynchus tshawytscha TaxID=74940 RepID=A0AAZ3SQM9_ONCTS